VSADPWLEIAHADGRQEAVRLSLALTTFGRSEQNVIELLDPKLSRFHCEIERQREGYVVRDCASRNGTLVNGEPVRGRRLLRDGDRIKIGRTFLTFTFTPGGTAAGRSPLGAGDDPSETDGVQLPSAVRPQTAVLAVPAAGTEEPWRFMARVGVEIMDATNRVDLLELAAEAGRSLFDAQGALVVLGRDAANPTIGADLGVEDHARERCLEAARTTLAVREVVSEERAVLSVPLEGEEDLLGALVLYDLAATPAEGSAPLDMLCSLARLVGRALTRSLSLEEVRRSERAADARRIAHDLRTLLRPDSDPGADGLEVAAAASHGDEVGAGHWDWVRGPARAGRQEVYFAFGDVPDAAAPLRVRLRRRGERSFLSLLGQAELRGALRAMVEVMPRTSDLLAELDKSVRRDGCVSSLSLALCRYDPTTGLLRFSGAGHEPLLIRRADGAVESVEASAPALGSADVLKVAEQDLGLDPGDQVLFCSAACERDGLAGRFGRVGTLSASPGQVLAHLLDAQQGPGAGGEAAMLLLRRVGPR
jgi:hypothetical protein